MVEWEQWEAVQGPRSHCGFSSSVTRRYGTGPMADLGGLAAPMGRPLICQATYDKMEKRRSVRRPQTWHMVEWEQWEAVQVPRSHCGPS
ncbi:unnamed protein product, partial [Staurois parvus]